MKTAIYPGSFDPVTLGHLDVIQRAGRLFDRLVVAVLINPNKKAAFTVEERMELLHRVTKEIPNVQVTSFNGLLADYAKENSIDVIVKGLRALSDFEYEFQMALTNKRLNSELETVFLTTSAENMFLSSSMVKEIAAFGGDLSTFVPAQVLSVIQERLYAGGRKR